MDFGLDLLDIDVGGCHFLLLLLEEFVLGENDLFPLFEALRCFDAWNKKDIWLDQRNLSWVY